MRVPPGAARQPVALHVSPHPDDESIAVPCTLLALRVAGWTVVNAAVSLGRPADRERRRAELDAALAVAGLEGVVWDLDISRDDDLDRAARQVARAIGALRGERGVDLVIGPHPGDGHHGHVAVARGIRRAVRSASRESRPLPWWMWSVWADLPRPTLVVDCPEEHLRTSERMLARHAGEIARTPYDAMHRPVRVVNAVRGIEKVFGYGSAPPSEAEGIRHAELLTELTVRRGRWMIGRPRVLDPARTGPEVDDDAGWDRLRDRSVLRASVTPPAIGPAAARSGTASRSGGS